MKLEHELYTVFRSRTKLVQLMECVHETLLHATVRCEDATLFVRSLYQSDASLHMA